MQTIRIAARSLRRVLFRPAAAGCVLIAAGCLLSAVRAQEPPELPSASPEKVTPAPQRPIVVVIPIHREIEWGLVHMVLRGIGEARDMGADLIMLDIDTPGGRVDAAVKIKDALLEAAAAGIDTAAFADPEAISAGALLALSTKKIFIVQSGLIGAAAPVLSMGFGMQEAPEKIVSYVRGQFESVAELNGYPVNVALAMVDPNMPVEGLTERGQLLTLTADSAVEYHIAQQIVPNLDEAVIAAGYTNSRIYHVTENWSESIARFIKSTAVTMVLMIVGIIAIVVEFYTPGIGIPAAIGIACFGLVFWGHTVAGLAGYESLILFGIGLILLGIEIFVIPGFGVVGILGILFIFVSLVLAIMDNLPWHEGAPLQVSEILGPMAMVTGSFLIGLAAVFVLSLFLPRRWTFARLTLAESQVKEAGYAPLEKGVGDLLGETGVAVSDLRPAGVARIADRRIDVVSRGDHILRGTKIRVVEVEGRRIVVKRV